MGGDQYGRAVLSGERTATNLRPLPGSVVWAVWTGALASLQELGVGVRNEGRISGYRPEAR